MIYSSRIKKNCHQLAYQDYLVSLCVICFEYQFWGIFVKHHSSSCASISVTCIKKVIITVYTKPLSHVYQVLIFVPLAELVSGGI